VTTLVKGKRFEAAFDLGLNPSQEDSLRRQGWSLLLVSLKALKRKPSLRQWPVLVSPKRTVLPLGGVRSGKSDVSTKFLWGRKLYPVEGQEWEPPLYWLVGNEYPLVKEEFRVLTKEAQQLGLLKKATNRIDPGEILLTDGTVIETKSGSDPKSLVGRNVSGIIMCEAGQCDYEIYLRCLERVAQSKGWILMPGTMEKAQPWFPKQYLLWKSGIGDAQSYSLPSWSNEFVFPRGRNDPEILRLEREMPPDVFLEHVAGEPVPPVGLVFPSFNMDIHIKKVRYDPKLPVLVGIDPGFAGACAYECFQMQDHQLRGFFEVFERGLIVDDVVQIFKKQPFWKEVTRKDGPGLHMVEDVYGDQHHHMSSVAEKWREKTGIRLWSNKVRSVNDVNARVKDFLDVDRNTGEPRVVFDPSMKGILSNFGAYPNPHDQTYRSYRWRLDGNNQVIGNVPEDKNCDGIKAMGYLIIDRFGYADYRGTAVAKVVYH